MKYCITCSMPMLKPEDFALKNESSDICCYCSNEDGSIKTCNEIFEGGVEYFQSITEGYDKTFMERIVRYTMNNYCPYWNDKNEEILKGEMATKDEFDELMSKLKS